MNRREFTRNLLAAATIPALPVPAMAKAQTVVVPKAARFWAIYMTHLHGDITPGMLTQMTGIAPAQTTAIRAKLIADKVISPTGFVPKGLAAQSIARSQKQTEATLTKLKERFTKSLDLMEETAKETEDLTQLSEEEPVQETPQDDPEETREETTEELPDEPKDV